MLVATGVGSEIHLVGQPRLRWTRLASTADAGATQITLETNVNWRVGDAIVVASTDFSAEQSEERTITAVNGNSVTLDRPLQFMHFAGQVETDFSIAGEVGYLGSNVVVMGDMSGASQGAGYGGHSMVMPGSAIHFVNVLLRDMGQQSQAARYPIHFHNALDASTSTVENNAIYKSNNRAVVLHGTNNALIKGNVAYRITGSAYFIEDGIEINNTLEGNLAVSIFSEHGLLPFDREMACCFWITNPGNNIIGNACAGAKKGFWWALPVHPIGDAAGLHPTIWNHHLPLGTVEDNVAHSIRNEGFYVDKTPTTEGTTPKGAWYRPRSLVSGIVSNNVDDILRFGDREPAVFRGAKAYKCTVKGVWARGDSMVWDGARLADNSVNFEFAGNDNRLQNAIIVGDSINIGNPTTSEYGRSRPYGNPRKSISGYQFYHDWGPTTLANVVMSEFRDETLPDGSVRKTGAISQESGVVAIYQGRSKQFNMVLKNVDNAFYLPVLEAPTLNRGLRNANLLDTDGSMTGTCGAQIIALGDWMRYDGAERCQLKSGWNAYVCPPDYPAHRMLHVEELTGGLGSFTATRGHLTQLYGNRATNVMLGEDPSFATHDDPHQGIYRRTYEATVLMNADYFLQWGDESRSPSNFALFIEFAPVSEYLTLVIPYPSGTTFEIGSGRKDGGAGVIVYPFTSVTSRSELGLWTYYFDSNAGLLYLKYGASSNSMGYYPITNPFGGFVLNSGETPYTLLNARRVIVHATCPGECRKVVDPASLQGSIEVKPPAIPRCGEDLLGGVSQWTIPTTGAVTDHIILDQGTWADHYQATDFTSVPGAQAWTSAGLFQGPKVSRNRAFPVATTGYTHLKLTIRLAGLQGRHNPKLAIRFYRVDASYRSYQLDNFVEIFTPWFGANPYVRDEFVDFYVNLDQTRVHELGFLHAFDLMSVQSRPWSWEVSHISLVKREWSVTPAAGPPPCFMSNDYEFCGFGTPPHSTAGGATGAPSTTLATGASSAPATGATTTNAAVSTSRPVTSAATTTHLPTGTTVSGSNCGQSTNACETLAAHWTRCKVGAAFTGCRLAYVALCSVPPSAPTCPTVAVQQCATAGAAWQVNHCVQVLGALCAELAVSCPSGGAVTNAATLPTTTTASPTAAATTTPIAVSSGLCARMPSECATLANHWTRCKPDAAFASCRVAYESACISPPSSCIGHIQCASAGAPWQVAHCTTVMNQFCQELSQCRASSSIGALSSRNGAQNSAEQANNQGSVSPGLIGGIFAGVFVLALIAAVVVIVVRRRAARFSSTSAYQPLVE